MGITTVNLSTARDLMGIRAAHAMAYADETDLRQWLRELRQEFGWIP